MFLPALIAALVAAGAAPSSAPITVTGHAWAPFISPMGEPFRARSADDDTLADWFRGADRNGDGYLTAEEMDRDAQRFFATLDSNHDGEIDPDELAHYEYEIAPDIQVMARTKRAPGQRAQAASAAAEPELDPHRRRRWWDGGADVDSSLGIGGALQGAARYGLLNLPEPVAAADSDFDRAITLSEFRQAAIARFQLLDRAHSGRLTLAQLEALRPALPQGGRRPKPNDKAPDARIGNPLPSGP